MSYIRMFVTLVRAERIKRSDPQNANYSTENICLLEVKFYKFLGSAFDEINGLPDMDKF